jgi:hypothetical protein
MFILACVLGVLFFYGYETWSLTLNREYRLRVFLKRVLRRIFEPKREEVTRGWRRPHNEEFHKLCASPNIIRVIKWRRINGQGM